MSSVSPLRFHLSKAPVVRRTNCVRAKIVNVAHPRIAVGGSNRCTGLKGVVRDVDEAPEVWAGMGEL